MGADALRLLMRPSPAPLLDGSGVEGPPPAAAVAHVGGRLMPPAGVDGREGVGTWLKRLLMAPAQQKWRGGECAECSVLKATLCSRQHADAPPNQHD